MTTRSADRIAATLRQQGIPTQALHSGLGSNQRNDLLRRFAEQRLKALVAPMVLDEGVDVPKADLAIVVAASRTRRQMIQRMGRVLRKKTDGRLARIAIVYAAKSFEDPQRGAHEAFLDSVLSCEARVAGIGPRSTGTTRTSLTRRPAASRPAGPPGPG
jgi:superfamily II DNA or RNA helicase